MATYEAAKVDEEAELDRLLRLVARKHAAIDAGYVIAKDPLNSVHHNLDD